MARRKAKSERDIEKGYPARQFVAKLRRLADCIEQGARFRIQVAGDSGKQVDVRIGYGFGKSIRIPDGKLIERFAGHAVFLWLM